MDRARASINAQPTTAPSRLGMLLALCLAYVPTDEVRLQADGMGARLRRRMHRLLGHAGMDTEANTAITGLIELLVGFVVLVFCVLIAFLLLPLVNSSSADLQNDPNTTSQQKSVLPTVGLILVVSVIVMALGFMFVGFRNLTDSFRH
ncbi:MAG TPA: hypothetical protein VIM84_05320 [Gemmatimonadales bacterium]